MPGLQTLILVLHALAARAAPGHPLPSDYPEVPSPPGEDPTPDPDTGHEHKPGGACFLVNPLCQQRGLNIDYYANDFGGYSRVGSKPWSYYITEGLSPLASSTTDSVYFAGYDPPPSVDPVYPSPEFPNWPYWPIERTVNGGIAVDYNNFTLVYQGFYRARETGRHTLCTSSDNENDVFFGHGSAFSCLGGGVDAGAAPLLVTRFALGEDTTACADVDLVKGLFYPVRSVMGNYQGQSSIEVTIREPDSEEGVHDFAGRVYQTGCGLFS